MNEFRQRLQGLLGLSKERFRENKVGELCLSSDGEEFKQAISSLSSAGFTMVCMFAAEDVGRHRGITIFHVFEKSGYREFLVLGKSLSAEKTQSIVMEFPAACWYEREISDGYGIEFAGSPDTRHLFLHEGFPSKFHPLRKSFKNGSIKTNISSPPHEAYVFKQVHGEGVYQIPVGPVHAGIIEPGHFRFSVIGETIFNLEIRMFWKHRGIEKLAEGKSPDQVVALAQSISGDETVANSWAYCMAVERISGMNVPLERNICAWYSRRWSGSIPC